LEGGGGNFFVLFSFSFSDVGLVLAWSFDGPKEQSGREMLIEDSLVHLHCRKDGHDLRREK